MNRLLIGTVVFVAATLVLVGSTASGIVLINNGLGPPNPENVIDADDPVEIYFVRNVNCGTPEIPVSLCSDPGDATTAEIADGAIVESVFVTETSAVEVTGGEIFHLLGARGQNALLVSGGEVDEVRIGNRSSGSSIEVNGGSIGILNVFGDALATVNGGFLNVLGAYNNVVPVEVNGGELFGVDVTDGAVVINDGSIRSVETGFGGPGTKGSAVINDGLVTLSMAAFSESTLTFDGGTFSGTRITVLDFAKIFLRGGTVMASREIVALESGRIEIAGSDFEVDGVPVGLGLIPAPSGLLTGKLMLGGTIDAQFFHNGAETPAEEEATGEIVLVAPEPAQALMIAAMLFALLGRVAWERRRALSRAAAA